MNTPFGNLEIIDIYDYYDIPCLFLCRSEGDYLYLSLCIGQTSEYGLWLYLPLSYERLQLLISREMTIRQAFIEVEQGFIYRLLLGNEDVYPDSINALSPDQLLDEWLPHEDIYLE